MITERFEAASCSAVAAACATLTIEIAEAD